MEFKNKSQALIAYTQEQKLQQFYKLHYPQRKQSQSPQIQNKGFRAKSVITIIQGSNPQEIPRQIFINKKGNAEKNRGLELSAEKSKKQISKPDAICFKKLLSSQSNKEQIQKYFRKNPEKVNIDLEEYSKKNVGVQMTLQKVKDQKKKINKVMNSHKQSQETKLDYLQLKRKDIDDEISKQIRVMYDQFFRKQYQQLFESKGYAQFQKKVKTAMALMHKSIYSNQ